MNAEQVLEASRILWSHWQSGTRLPALPDHCRPRTREEGYAVQAQVRNRSGQRLLGWKIAATSPAGQRHLNVDGPLAGSLLAGRAYQAGATVPLGSNHMRVAEPEFAFRFAGNLPARSRPYTAEETLSAVGSLHPAIEIPDSRFEVFASAGAPQLIADNACAHYVVFGTACPEDWRDLDLVTHAVRFTVGGKGSHEGTGANVLGDPRVALAWLVQEINGLGLTVEAGQMVITGTCLPPMGIEPGDTLCADFGKLGLLEARIGA